jgi:ubiquitin-protein ligase E3 C
MDESVVRSCLAFVQAVTSSSKKEGVAVQVMQTCRAMLLAADLLPTALSSAVDIPMSISVDSDKADTSPRKTKSIGSQKLPYYALKNSPLDLISILRYHLLYVTGGAPIPSTSNSVREACIPAKQQKQASELFQTVFSILTQHQERQQIWERLVSEILTVPLLTWKVSNSALSLLLSCSRQNKLRRSQPLLVSLLEVFVDVHWDVINNGQIESLLCQDISLSKCNATPSQALLANLTQLGQSSVQLNASHPFKMDFDASIVYFRFIGSLVDAVPVSTLSSRESVVEWIDDGRGHHSPVVLSPVILEQCRMLVMDSWIRKLFNCAIDIEYLETESILSEKTDKDLKLAKEMADVAASSAAFLAAKEARVDRNKAFWKSAGWARKISKGMSTVLSKGNKTESDKTEKSGLINATALSRKLAAKGGDDNGGIVSRMESSLDRVKTESARSESYSPELLKVLCIVYGIVLSRWGGGGGEDIVRPKRITTRNEAGRNVVATSTPDPWTQSFLSVVCFSSPFIRVSWALIQGEKALSPNHEKAPVKSLSIRPRHNDTSTGSQSSNGPAIFYLFIAALSHVLILTDDVEIHDLGRPIPIHQLRRVIIALKNLLYKASCIDEGSTWSLEESKPSPCEESNYFGLALIQASSKTMRDLYDRSSRRPICVPKLWTIDDLMEKEFRKCKTKDDYVALLNAPVLRVCPFLVSFKRRLRLFERIVYTDRVQMQGENNANPFNPNPLKPGIPVRITRGRILEDGLATMNNLGSNMRQRIAIQYYNEAGAKETGIDAGGLFKEFWTDLSASTFISLFFCGRPALRFSQRRLLFILLLS